MSMRLLDCTVRDGGYINDWNFGNKTIKNIFKKLVAAGVDIVEVGFLRNCEYSQDRTLYNNIAEIKPVLPKEKGNTKFVAMALHNMYDITKLEPCDGTIAGVRVTFHDYDIDEGLEFCKKVLEKGYECYCQPINIMGYTDEQILGIVKKVNAIKPTGFAIVDTFGSMMKEDLLRIAMIVDNNLDPSITMGVHLHENLSLSYSLAQEFINLLINRRNIIVDGSLSGMGRVPGNLCIELISDYMNRVCGKNYDADALLDAINDYILPIKEKTPWGYSAPYSISAKYNLHRNYAENLVDRGVLTAKDMNHILAMIEPHKKTVFDKDYIEKLFYEYQSKVIDDKEDMVALKKVIEGKEVLVVAPGKSIVEYEETINDYIGVNHPVVICANFISESIKHDFAFFTNTKRYEDVSKENESVIVTSNLIRDGKHAGYAVNYNNLVSIGESGSNNVIMLLKLLKLLGASKVSLAGCDGYSKDKANYFDNNMAQAHKISAENNQNMAARIKQLSENLEITFLTPSNYEGLL